MTISDPTVLIVEDEPMIALDIAATAQDAGYSPHVVPSLSAAHEALRCFPIIGAILDFRASDGDTGGLSRCLRRLGIPFVVVSASPRVDIERAGIENRRILSKPANYERALRILQDDYGMPLAFA